MKGLVTTKRVLSKNLYMQTPRIIGSRLGVSEEQTVAILYLLYVYLISCCVQHLVNNGDVIHQLLVSHLLSYHLNSTRSALDICGNV